jgi:two-component system, chemotaxis family, protein-glutamate methylesterase/glutaminase
MSTRVLIVDDSATMRALLSRLLGSEPDIEVVGTAADAMEARDKIKQLNPDVVTLDIEMPGMNGLEFLDKIMRLRPMPVVIVSGVTKRNCDTTVRALELGAVDCYAKPDGSVSALIENDGGDLARMVRSAGRIGRWRTPETLQQSDRVQRQTIAVSTVNGVGTRLIAIGASTGGVEALHHLLPAFPENCPPTLIVQHISAAFAPAMADRLNQRCAATVTLAEAGIPLREGHIYIAGGNERHMVLSGGGDKLLTRSVVGDLVSGHRPSIDMMFESVAKILGPAAVGILLTGMGQDGARGLLAMRKAGGRTIAQDEATSTVYGMPRAAADMGAAEKILPLPRIAERALSGVRQ